MRKEGRRRKSEVRSLKLEDGLKKKQNGEARFSAIEQKDVEYVVRSFQGRINPQINLWVQTMAPDWSLNEEEISKNFILIPKIEPEECDEDINEIIYASISQLLDELASGGTFDSDLLNDLKYIIEDYINEWDVKYK